MFTSRKEFIWGIALLLALSMFYYRGVMLNILQARVRASHQLASGNWSDIYPTWYGSRELLLHRRNPYSQEVTREIQQGFYGRTVEPSHRGEPRNREDFLFPAYVAFLMAPLLLLPFRVVQIVFPILLLIATIGSIPLWLRALELDWTREKIAFTAVLTLGSYPVLHALYLQQITLMFAVLLAGVFALLAREKYVPAGVLLGLATAKPQLAVFSAIWLMFWALGDWRKRQGIVFAFLVMVASLISAAEFFLPGWMVMWLHLLPEYAGQVGPSGLRYLFGQWGQILISAGLVSASLLQFWRCRRAVPASPEFRFALVLSLFLPTVLSPGTPLYNQVLLLPAVLWLSCQEGRGRSFAFAMLGLEWLTALALCFIFLVARRIWLVHLPEAVTFLFPLCILPVLCLSWYQITCEEERLRSCSAGLGGNS